MCFNAAYTLQCGFKNTDIELKTLRVQDMMLLLENFLLGGISSVMGDRYVKSDQNKKILYFDATISYRQSISQPLPYNEINFDRNNNLEDSLNTPAESDIEYYVEVNLLYPDNVEEKKNFPLCPEK